MTELYTKDQVLEMLRQQRSYCNIANNNKTEVLTAVQPEFPVPAYIKENSVVTTNDKQAEYTKYPNLLNNASEPTQTSVVNPVRLVWDHINNCYEPEKKK